MTSPELKVEVSPRDTADADIDGMPEHVVVVDVSTPMPQVPHASAAPVQSHAQVQAQVPSQTSQTSQAATDASVTTDPHHDRGSSATGHVEDASPDPRGAGPAEEPEPEPEPVPEPEVEEVPPPPVEATPDPATTTVEADGS